MKIWDVVDNYIANEVMTRQTGKSTALKEAAKKIDALYLCFNERAAKRHEGISMYDHSIIGSTKPLIFDHFALCNLFKELRKSYEEIKAKHDFLLKFHLQLNFSDETTELLESLDKLVKDKNNLKIYLWRTFFNIADRKKFRERIRKERRRRR